MKRTMTNPWLAVPRNRRGTAAAALAAALIALYPGMPAGARRHRGAADVDPAREDANAAAAAVIAEHVDLYRPLYDEHSEAFWESMTSGSAEAFARRAAIEQQIQSLRGDAGRFARIEELLADDGLTDPLLRRQLEMLHLEYLPQQIPAEARARIVEIENECDRVFSNYRFDLDGEQASMSTVENLMVTSTDGARLERAWKRSKLVGADLLPLHRELVGLRNEVAREMGYADYYELALRARDYDPAWLDAFMADLDRITAEPFRQLKEEEIDPMLARRFAVPVDELMPWHYGNPYFQDIPPGLYELDLDPLFARRDHEQVVGDARDFYGGIGLPVDGILARSDLYPREGKNPHAMAHKMVLDRADTSRLLMNLPLPPETQNRRETATLLHELGHTVHYEGVDLAQPYLFLDVESQPTEAYAMLMERQVVSPGWLEGYLGVEHDEAEELSRQAFATLRAQELIFARWCLVIYHWEKDIYADPNQDWGDVWWRHKERYQLLRRPEGWSNPDPLAKYHLAAGSAGGYNSYVMGAFIAAQFATVLADTIGEDVRTASYRGHPEVGRWLDEHVAVWGSRYGWLELVERATGRPLGTEAWARQFLGGDPARADPDAAPGGPAAGASP